MSEVRQYENRQLAYVDILGWSEACCNPKKSADELYKVLEPIYQPSEEYNEGQRIKIRNEGDTRRPSLKHRYGVFSDCFVFSVPIGSGTNGMLFEVAKIARKLLSEGFLCRGAVIQGSVFHQDNLIFGPDMVRAVNLEKKTCYPRILCDFKVVESAQERGNAPIIRDPNGVDVIDIFSPCLVTSPLNADKLENYFNLSAIIKKIQDNLTTLKNEPILDKWKYARDMTIISLSQWGSAAAPFIEKLEKTRGKTKDRCRH